jgi:hypothetical protein
MGKRELIPWIVRCAVYYRDDGTCQICGQFRPKPVNLDHVIPWSAGGSDRSHNLRVACESCNVERSNYVDGTEERSRPPVTWWCVYCHSTRHEVHPRHWVCAVAKCRVNRVGRSGQMPDDWYEQVAQVEPLTADTFAFCAHCNDYGYTERRNVL